MDPYTHYPIELAIKFVDLSQKKIVDQYSSIIRCSQSAWENSDKASLEVNGFTRDKVSAGKDINVVKEEIITKFTHHGIKRGSAVFICQNPSFDRAFFNRIVNVYLQEELHWPYHWLDLASMYWARIASDEKSVKGDISLSKNSIAKSYNLPIESHPHEAMNGVDHLILCYQAVMNIKIS